MIRCCLKRFLVKLGINFTKLNINEIKLIKISFLLALKLITKYYLSYNFLLIINLLLYFLNNFYSDFYIIV